MLRVLPLALVVSGFALVLAGRAGVESPGRRTPPASGGSTLRLQEIRRTFQQELDFSVLPVTDVTTSIPRFDPGLGQLVGVLVETTTSFSGSWTATNLRPTSVTHPILGWSRLTMGGGVLPGPFVQASDRRDESFGPNATESGTRQAADRARALTTDPARLAALSGGAPLLIDLELAVGLSSLGASDFLLLGAGTARHELRVVYVYR